MSISLFSIAAGKLANSSQEIKPERVLRTNDAFHISDKKGASEFASLLGRVRERAEVATKNDARH
jgi:hypothetical protein